MLVVIFECILESRLPVSKGIRGSRSDLDKIEVMKIFLGVLETDIIKMVVGIGNVHPRALARGDELETVFVGELLCRLGQKSGILPFGQEGAIPRQNEVVEVANLAEEEDDDGEEDVLSKARDNTISSTDSRHGIRVATSSTRSTLTDSARTTLSMINASHPETDTSVMTMSFNDDPTIIPPATPRVFTQQSIPHSTHLSPHVTYTPRRVTRSARGWRCIILQLLPQARSSNSTHRLDRDR